MMPNTYGGHRYVEVPEDVLVQALHWSRDSADAKSLDAIAEAVRDAYPDMTDEARHEARGILEEAVQTDGPDSPSSWRIALAEVKQIDRATARGRAMDERQHARAGRV